MVDHNVIKKGNIINIYAYLIKTLHEQLCLDLLSKRLLRLSFGGSLATKYVSLDNQSCIAGPPLISSNADDLRYYSFRQVW